MGVEEGTLYSLYMRFLSGVILIGREVSKLRCISSNHFNAFTFARSGGEGGTEAKEEMPLHNLSRI